MKKTKKLNVQGLARREPLLMECFPAPPETVYVSIDLAAGEPSVCTHFSEDPVYRYATFDGVGKVPHYRDSVLYIDDIYLMGMSVSPVGRDKLRAAFDRGWPAGSFADQWLKDPDVIKNALKKERAMHKMLILALSYGVGAKKMVKQCYEAGINLSLRDAKEFHAAYWTLFKGVKSLSKRLARQMGQDGYIVNPFGYRGVPLPHNALNFFFQSAVSGIMHVYLLKLAALAPYMKLITIIHDELLCEIPKVLVEQFRKDSQAATDSLNVDLGWSVNIRTGFVVGDSFYTAK